MLMLEKDQRLFRHNVDMDLKIHVRHPENNIDSNSCDQRRDHAICSEKEAWCMFIDEISRKDSERLPVWFNSTYEGLPEVCGITDTCK